MMRRIARTPSRVQSARAKGTSASADVELPRAANATTAEDQVAPKGAGVYYLGSPIGHPGKRMQLGGRAISADGANGRGFESHRSHGEQGDAQLPYSHTVMP